MTTQKPTASKKKLELYAATRDLDERALELAKRDGIAMVEAYGRLSNEQIRAEMKRMLCAGELEQR